MVIFSCRSAISSRYLWDDIISLAEFLLAHWWNSLEMSEITMAKFCWFSCLIYAFLNWLLIDINWLWLFRRWSWWEINKRPAEITTKPNETKTNKMTVGTTFQPHMASSNQSPMMRNFPMNFFSSPSNLQHHQLTDTKGLLNGPGQNNCFLNCAVQVSSNFGYHL